MTLVQISPERERNGYDDSDFSITVLDLETGKIRSYLVGSTRFGGGCNYSDIRLPSELTDSERAAFLGAVWGHAVAQAESTERCRVECPYSLIGFGRRPQPGDRVVTRVDHHNRRREECACAKCGGTGKWISPRNESDVRKCFKCDGAGSFSCAAKGKMVKIPAGTAGTILSATERRSQYGTFSYGWTIRIRRDDGTEFNFGDPNGLQLDECPDFRRARDSAELAFDRMTRWTCPTTGRKAA